MYHPAAKYDIKFHLNGFAPALPAFVCLIALLAAIFFIPAAIADPNPSTTTDRVLQLATAQPSLQKVSIVSQDFSMPPSGRALRQKPANIEIYQYDQTPINNRAPFLFVHGLKGEYWPTMRWQQIIKRFVSNAELNKRYKIYLVRYDSSAPTAKTINEFKGAVATLYQACNQKPITVLSLSIGGNIVYESMLDKATDNCIRLVFALGTPFHGSPLFSKDWMLYSVYKNFAMPWTRIDRSVAFSLYFHRNPNLLQDFRWDNADNAIPDVGKFSSLLPLGPKGDLTADLITNRHLIEINEHNVDKKKLITYSGYLLNPYMGRSTIRAVKSTILAPYTLLTIELPAHFAREHAVLKMLNCEISGIIPNEQTKARSQTPFIYQLNDGITPIESAIFLPENVCRAQALAREADLKELCQFTDVRLARVFRNMDHLTFLDGFRPRHSSGMLRDELHPQAVTRKIFDWIMADILANQDQNTRL